MTTACAHGGFIPTGNGDGGQGELVGVPLADGTLVTVPGSPSDYRDDSPTKPTPCGRPSTFSAVR